MFTCPRCGGDSRAYARKKTEEKGTYGRYRSCIVCGYRFSTIERVNENKDEIKVNYLKGYRDAVRMISQEMYSYEKKIEKELAR